MAENVRNFYYVMKTSIFSFWWIINSFRFRHCWKFIFRILNIIFQPDELLDIGKLGFMFLILFKFSKLFRHFSIVTFYILYVHILPQEPVFFTSSYPRKIHCNLSQCRPAKERESFYFFKCTAWFVPFRLLKDSSTHLHPCIHKFWKRNWNRRSQTIS